MFELRFVAFGMNQAIGGITDTSLGGSFYGDHTRGLLLHLLLKMMHYLHCQHLFGHWILEGNSQQH